MYQAYIFRNLQHKSSKRIVHHTLFSKLYTCFLTPFNYWVLGGHSRKTFQRIRRKKIRLSDISRCVKDKWNNLQISPVGAQLDLTVKPLTDKNLHYKYICIHFRLFMKDTLFSPLKHLSQFAFCKHNCIIHWILFSHDTQYSIKLRRKFTIS